MQTLADIEYYVFDPHSRDRSGMPTVDGCSVLSRFQTLDGIVNHVANLGKQLSASQFDIRTYETDRSGSQPMQKQ